ncbi:hypothetical protein [Streptococcus merionis]|uniref:IS66 family element, Orf1 n=1 Tax=Streptococcus merionis TaxID=400065 RepID=A0A239SZR7_9STRE|nr:hypothetical protein [Streptococcus merionis]SNU90816.1 IS66 family element, Orf1 [Streptococcus merionis]
MSQPIVPLKLLQSRSFPKKSRNEMMVKIRVGKLELSLFRSCPQEMIETILDKVLNNDHSTK